MKTISTMTQHTPAKYIVQRAKDGTLIATYYTARQAEKATSIDHSNITKAIKGNRYKTAGGFIWERAERKGLPAPTKPL